MRNAMNRALDEISNDYCNNCENPFDKNQGGYIDYADLITVTKMYKVWYCDDCFELMVF